MKQLFLVLGIILASLAIVYGAVMPYGKSSAYITAIGNLSNIHSLDEFKSNFDSAFNFYSPIGNEEIAKFLSSDVVNLVGQDKQTEAVSRMLVEYIEPHIMQDNPLQQLTMAQMYSELWVKSQKKADYEKAVNYYQKMLTIGPNLPPALYGLYGLYTASGDKANAHLIASEILKYWPDDKTVSAQIK